MIPGLDAILAGAGAFAGQLIGDLLAAGDHEAIKRLIQENMDEFGNVNFDRLEQTSARLQGQTEFDNIDTDQAPRNAQMKALESLGREAEFQGMTPEDRAMYEEFNQENAQRERGNREALMERTNPGSGGRIALAALNQQQSANRAHGAGVQMAGDARMRALQSMAAYGDMAGSIRGQDYGEASDRARAQDAINRFNTSQQTDNDRYNNDVIGANRDFELGLADRRAGNRGTQMQYHQGNINRFRQTGAAVGGAVGAGAGLALGGSPKPSAGVTATGAASGATAGAGRSLKKRRPQ